jgi:hypothetical protein
MFCQRRRESPLRKRNATLNLTPHSATPAASTPAAAGIARTADILSQIIVQGLEDAKAEEIVSIDLSGRTTLADRLRPLERACRRDRRSGGKSLS